MASGDSILESYFWSVPDASAANPDTRLGGSTPGETVPVLDFSAGVVEYVDLHCRVGVNAILTGGFTVSFPASASSAITGNMQFDAAVRRINFLGEDIDTAHTYVYQTATVAAPGTNGQIASIGIVFTGVQIDGLLAGEPFILRIRRDGVTDTMAGDAELWPSQIAIRE